MLCCNTLFSQERMQVWHGDWHEIKTNERSLSFELPFYSEYLDNAIVIYNNSPDRDIYYEIVDEVGVVFISNIISQNKSAHFEIAISNLPSNNSYIIVLRSTYPEDMVYSQFRK